MVRLTKGAGKRLFIVLGQGQVAPELLQMRGHDCPSDGLWPLWRVEPDLERDRDSHQHATQHNDLGRCHCPWPCEPSYYPTRRVISSPDNDSTIAAVRPPVTARNTSSLVV